MDWLGLAVGVVGVGIGIVALLEIVPEDFRSFTLYGGIALVVIGVLMTLVPISRGTKKFLWITFGPYPMPRVFAAFATGYVKMFPENANAVFSEAVRRMANHGWITVFGVRGGDNTENRLVAIPQSYFYNHKIFLVPHLGTARTYDADENPIEFDVSWIHHRKELYFNLHVSRNIFDKLADFFRMQLRNAK